MRQVTSKLTTVVAGLALASLPALVGAQSTSTPQQTYPKPTTSQQSRSTKDQGSPQHHLDEAKRVLNSISDSSLEGEARTQITELRRHFNQLESAWRSKAAGAARSGAAGHVTGHTGTATGSTGATTSGTAAGATAGTTGTPEQAGATGSTTSGQTPRSSTMAKGSDDWMTHYQAVDRVLDGLLGGSSASGRAGGTASGTTSGTGTATGTTGGTATGTTGASATVMLDAETRTKLTEFRRHLEMFHQTAMAQGRTGEEHASASSTTSTSSTTGTTGSMTGTATGTSGMATHPETTTAQTPPAQTPTPRPQTQTTTTTTTTGAVDSAAIARLTAQIDELLRASASTSATAGTTSTAGTPTTGTAGTSGTTTASSATVCVDRAKLEQLKRDIQALQSGSRR